MLYCGLPGRHFWLSAIIAPRSLHVPPSPPDSSPSIVFVSLILKNVPF